MLYVGFIEMMINLISMYEMFIDIKETVNI